MNLGRACRGRKFGDGKLGGVGPRPAQLLFLVGLGGEANVCAAGVDCPRSKGYSTVVRTTVLPAGLFMMATLLLGCGNLPFTGSDGGAGHADANNIGAPCDILTDAGPRQGVFNTEDLQCTSLWCIKPVDLTGSADTWPFCTAKCSTDSDCVGRLRNTSDPNDRACVSGFTCGVAFVRGTICCVKVCQCLDFTGGPISTPAACYLDAGQNCY
jgi:hypothetical protein